MAFALKIRNVSRVQSILKMQNASMASAAVVPNRNPNIEYKQVGAKSSLTNDKVNWKSPFCKNKKIRLMYF